MLPELSVEALQARLIESSVVAVIRRLVGTVGAAVSAGGRGGRGAAEAGAANATTASATHVLTARRRTFIVSSPERWNGAGPGYAREGVPVLAQRRD
jgi:hypothetical protein